MQEFLNRLTAKERRGSRLRCVLLTEGTKEEVAIRLNSIVTTWATVDPTRHVWQPQGWADVKEAKLGETAPFLSPPNQKAVTDWWLASKGRGQANTPNWDIISQATVRGQEGLILIEAKAHSAELKAEGKALKKDASADSRRNHTRITAAIDEANTGFNDITFGFQGLKHNFNLSINTHYQLANRFAWAYKLASLGVPVVLVYLAFSAATEMEDQGTPFDTATDWIKCLVDHAEGIVPDTAWHATLKVNGTPIYAIIRSTQQDIPPKLRQH